MVENFIKLGLVYGIVAFVGWGIADFLSAIVTRKLGNLRALMWVMIFSDILIIIYIIAVKPHFVFNLTAIFLSIGAGLLHTLGGLSFFEGMNRGKVSLVSALGSTWSIILVIFGLLVYREVLAVSQVVSIVIIIVGGILVSVQLKELFSSKFQFLLSDPGVKYGFGAMFFWGTGWLLLDEAIKKVGWLMPNIILTTTILLTVLMYLGFKKELQVHPEY